MEAEEMAHWQIVIFGGTGNLTFLKLLPALQALWLTSPGGTSPAVLALGRRDYDDLSYRERVKGEAGIDEPRFLAQIGYQRLDFATDQDYLDLAGRLDARPRLYYLATSPEFFSAIAARLRQAGLVRDEDRVVFEKPFGRDLASATEINRAVTRTFREENIYRIDHYLGKEMVQNIMILRFTNRIFESVWQNHDVEDVQLLVKEKEGIGDRGGYYDEAGALRDMVQSHLLQMLSLVAMARPVHFDTEYIRDEKVKVLRDIRIEDPARDLLFGQYHGYLVESRVPPGSTTETYVALRLAIENHRWRGVPFYLVTGKALDERRAEIIIRFKCQAGYRTENALSNLLIIKIQPEEGVAFRINVKQPGAESQVMSESMEYCHSCKFALKSVGAYEKLLGDALQGDKTLFTRWDELEYSWRVVDEILAARARLNLPVHGYPRHGRGPAAATELLPTGGVQWLPGVARSDRRD
ncbi:MAG TPA: glucose-6-phosphate dehydrogenase [Desulforhopalus sp.]|nr:glucose-6-phosphate dehydrogenase [Desulforhopalus sp.]